MLCLVGRLEIRLNPYYVHVFNNLSQQAVNELDNYLRVEKIMKQSRRLFLDTSTGIWSELTFNIIILYVTIYMETN